MQNFLFYDALLRRTNFEDPDYPKIEEQFNRSRAGLAGELKVRNYLEDHCFQHKIKFFYNYTAINNRGFSHQIDCIVLTEYFVLVLEVKQLTGVLMYEKTTHQFTKLLHDDTVQNIRNPFDQVYRHQSFIKELLYQNDVHIPVLQMVVISNFRARLHTSLSKMPIIHVSGLPSFIEQCLKNSPKTRVSIEHIEKILHSCAITPTRKPNININRIKLGVLCDDCDSRNIMRFYRGSWICDECGNCSKELVRIALHDYRLLVSPCIRNHEFRKFTAIESRFAATRMLNELKLGPHGIARGRGSQFYIPENIAFELEDYIFMKVK